MNICHWLLLTITHRQPQKNLNPLKADLQNSDYKNNTWDYFALIASHNHTSPSPFLTNFKKYLNQLWANLLNSAYMKTADMITFHWLPLTITHHQPPSLPHSKNICSDSESTLEASCKSPTWKSKKREQYSLIAFHNRTPQIQKISNKYERFSLITAYN